MDSVKVTYELPADLVAEAEELGMDVEQSTVVIEAWWERINQQKAMQRFKDIADKLAALPDELKPTPDEIVAEIRAYREEQLQKEQKQK